MDLLNRSTTSNRKFGHGLYVEERNEGRGRRNDKRRGRVLGCSSELV